MPINGTRFQGVGHMMMFGTNALEVFDGILKWSEPNIPNPIVEDARPNGRKPGKGPKIGARIATQGLLNRPPL